MIFKTINFHLLLLMITSGLLANVVEAQRSSFGEACGATQRCDRRAGLACIQDKCECMKKEEMIYEPSSNKCVSKAGERCKFKVELEGKVAYEINSCVENSICGPDGYCACNPDFHEISNGTCVPSRKYSETCDDQLKCAPHLGLHCRNGMCDCSSEAQFSTNDGACVGLVGGNCIDAKCAENARCELVSRKCSCKPGFFENVESKKCVRKLGLFQNCTSDEQCMDAMPLRCVEGICNCNSAISKLYKGPKIGETYPNAICIGKVNFPCVLSRCVPGARCLTDYVRSDFPIGAPPGMDIFRRSAKKLPGKRESVEAVPNPAMMSNSKTMSNSETMQNTEAMPDAKSIKTADGVQNPEQNKNSEVTSNSGNTPISDAKENSKISRTARGSLWAPRFDDDYGSLHGSSSEELPTHVLFPTLPIIPALAKIPTMQQMCVCDDGYRPTKAGTCGKPYGIPCGSGDCMDGLVCQGNLCSCRYPHEEFSRLTHSCRTKVRGPCASDEDCTDNAICSLFANEPFGQCSCKSGFIENFRRECDVEHGGECLKNSDCDSVAGLICSEGFCNCRDFARFSKDKRQCVGLVGGNCATSGESNCTENARCVGIVPGNGLTSAGTCACNDGFSVSPDYTCGRN